MARLTSEEREERRQGRLRWWGTTLGGIAAMEGSRGLLRGLGPDLTPAGMAAHDVFQPFNAAFQTNRATFSAGNIFRTLSNSAGASIGANIRTLGSNMWSSLRGLPWREMTTPRMVGEQLFQGPLAAGRLNQWGYNLTQYGPNAVVGLGADLGRGAVHDFGFGGPKGNSLLINVARAAAVAKILSPIPGAIEAARMGPVTDVGGNPMLTRQANAATAKKRMEESVAGLTLSLHELRGATVPF